MRRFGPLLTAVAFGVLAAPLVAWSAAEANEAPRVTAERSPASTGRVSPLSTTIAVTLVMPGSSNAGAVVRYTWSSRSLPRGGHLVLQRQFGTRHVWRTIATLRRASGRSTLSAPALGVYRYRILMTNKAGKSLAQSGRTLSSFGRVPFTTLLPSDGGVYTTPTRTFSYDLRDYIPDTGYVTTLVNHCNFVHVDWVPGDLTGGHVDSAAVTFVQESLGPASDTRAFDTIGALDVRVVPGQTWGLNFSSPGGSTIVMAFVNGYAMCTQATPAWGPNAA